MSALRTPLTHPTPKSAVWSALEALATLVAWMIGAVLIGGFLLHACATLAGCGPTKPACAPEGDLAKIEAAYVAEALEACRGSNYDDCKALPALREKYQQKRDAWARCGE